MESKYKIAIPRLIPNSTCIAEKYKCNIRLDDNLDTLFATVYGSTAQECESRAMLIVKADAMEDSIKELLALLRFHGYTHSTEISEAEQLLSNLDN